MNRTRHRGAALLLAIACWIAAAQSPAQQEAGKESKFKAAYLYNFLQFIEWPESSFTNRSSPVTIGILNQEPLANILEQIVQGERVHGREIVVRKFRDTKSIRECQVLFVPRSERNEIPSILVSTEGSSVLTVGEVDGFAEEGGAINFFVQENKLKFEINQDALKNANLRASSRLLRLARLVGSAEGGK
ncbi:MAG TPA: YfiR family protein [Bacteroidota bacterium]|jgi:hypothetical protein